MTGEVLVGWVSIAKFLGFGKIFQKFLSSKKFEKKNSKKFLSLEKF